MANPLEEKNELASLIMKYISTASFVAMSIGIIYNGISLSKLANIQEHSTRALLMHLHKGHNHPHENK